MSAIRAAVTSFAVNVSKAHPNELPHMNIAPNDVQVLAKDYLALLQERNTMIAPQHDVPQISDLEMRDRALELACELRNDEYMIQNAYLFRAFLQGNHDAALLSRYEGTETAEFLKKLVLGQLAE